MSGLKARRPNRLPQAEGAIMQGEPTTTRRGFFCPDWREIGLWSAAGLVIVCIHAGAAWSLQNIQPDEPSSDIAAAVMIDMEPLPAPVAAQPVRQEPPVEPEPVNPEPVQQEAAAPEPLEQVQAEPEPQIQPPEEITPDQPEPDLAKAVSPEPEEAEPLDEQGKTGGAAEGRGAPACCAPATHQA